MNDKNFGLILNSLGNTGIYVVREDDRRILYFNEVTKRLIPNIELGRVCHELWQGSCACCPLDTIGDRQTNQSFNYDGPNHKATDILASRILWDDKIPAFVVTFSPHAETYNVTYEKIVKGNLTTNECESVKMLDAERAMLPPEGFTLSMALESFWRGGYLCPDDVDRFRRFSDIAHMSAELRSGKRILMCNYRRRRGGTYRWNTMEVIPDIHYTDESQSVMIYVKDVQDVYTEGLEHEETNIKNEAILKTLGKENFGVYAIDLETGKMSRICVADEDRDFINPNNEDWESVLALLLGCRYHPDYVQRVREMLNLDALRRLNDSESKKSEMLAERKIGGEYHYISIRAYAHTDNEGRNYAILAFQDADERIRRELAHSQNEKRMASIIRSGFSSMATVDLESGQCECFWLREHDSDVPDESGSYSDYIAMAIQNIHPDDREAYLNIFSLESLRKNAQAVESYAAYPLQYRVGQKEPVQWVEQNLFYVRLETGVAVTILWRDITAEKERELEESRAASEKAAIINSMSSLFRDAGYINLETGTFRRIVRLDGKTQVLGDEIDCATDLDRYITGFVMPEDQEECRATIGYECLRRNLTLEHPSVALEYREKPSAESETRWLRTSVLLTRTDGGLPKGALYVAQDITEAKQKEIRDRQALQDAFDAANMASDSKSEFLSRMSHDIRTPLNAIIGMTAIAGTHIDDRERVLSCLGKITVSGRQLLALINEVLDLSKIESGKLDFTEEEFGLSSLFDDLLTVVQPSVQAKKQLLSVKLFQVEHEDVVGDMLRLQQVFTNILSNAVKYTPEGGKIEVEIHELPSKIHGYGYFEFIFRDNGIGMSEDYQKHIFEPFSRESKSSTDNVEGTGLGLAIAHNIVQMMSGDIHVKSREGEGSEFTITLFLKLQDTQSVNLDDLADLRVLVADDDQFAREAACDILSEIGMVGEGVASGQEALQRAQAVHGTAEDFFAVILDWKMPGMDGLETARRIRKTIGPDIPIIILSAYDWSAIEQEAREAGVDGFISKPLFKSRLVYLFKQLAGSEEKEKHESESLSRLGQRDFSGKRILLAEDNDMNREIAVSLIGMTGVQIECAVNGREALEMFQNSSPGYYDLIFMDIRMPIMNGHEAASAIRALPRPDAKTIPIIAMTADAFASDVLASRQAGMNEHVTKPLDFAVLTKCMEHWLG